MHHAAHQLTLWAHTHFAISPHSVGGPSPGGGGTQGPAALDTLCIYNSSSCRFNPMALGKASFPTPKTSVERILKQYALESYTCLAADDEKSCHQDPNCHWYPANATSARGTCALDHDPHVDLLRATGPCPDALHSRAARRCWRTDPGSPARGSTCEVVPGCKMYPKGTDGAGGAGIAQDRCMPYSLVAAEANSAHQRPGAERPSVREAYDILSRLYGPGFAGANETLAAAVAASNGGFIHNPHFLATKAALVHDALAREQEPKTGDVLIKAFGSCPAGPLHHAFLTACRHSSKAACTADPKCEWLHDATALPPGPPPMGGSGSSTAGGGEADRWAGVTVKLGEAKMGREGRQGKLGLRGRGHRMQGGLRGEHCVLALPTVVELLMGWSPFTQAVVKADALCSAAGGSADRCQAVDLGTASGAGQGGRQMR